MNVGCSCTQHACMIVSELYIVDILSFIPVGELSEDGQVSINCDRI